MKKKKSRSVTDIINNINLNKGNVRFTKEERTKLLASKKLEKLAFTNKNRFDKIMDKLNADDALRQNKIIAGAKSVAARKVDRIVRANLDLVREVNSDFVENQINTVYKQFLDIFKNMGSMKYESIKKTTESNIEALTSHFEMITSPYKFLYDTVKSQDYRNAYGGNVNLFLKNNNIDFQLDTSKNSGEVQLWSDLMESIKDTLGFTKYDEMQTSMKRNKMYRDKSIIYKKLTDIMTGLRHSNLTYNEKYEEAMLQFTSYINKNRENKIDFITLNR